MRPYSRFWFAFWFALLFACLFGAEQKFYGQAPVPSAPLTLQQVVDYTFAHNPALLAGAAKPAIDERAGDGSGATSKSRLFGIWHQSINPANSSTPYGYSLQMARLFERGQKRRWRLDSARATTAQTAGQLHDQERGTILAAKQAFTEHASGQGGAESRRG